MACDEGLVQIMRNDLCDVIGISEKKMFGGLACMHAGHMVCGVHKDGAMFRVGKIPRGRGQSH
jgi:L-alanine-DL-glutamate epimerase-like enolase superfamily enzyme